MAIKDELNISLEELHEYIDGATAARDAFQHYVDEKIHPAEWPALCDAVGTLDGFYLGPNLVIKAPQKVINAFSRNFDLVDRNDAYTLASKVTSFLRSIEGEFSEESESEAASPQSQTVSDLNQQPDLALPADQWVLVTPNPSLKEQIAELSILLDSIIESIRGSNLPNSDRALSEIERAQLIAILETALKLLKAPMIEKGLLKKSRDGLLDAAKKTAQKQTEDGFERLAEEGGRLLEILIRGLFG